MVIVDGWPCAGGARVDLGGAGVFTLPAYVRSRAAMTEEFERRMPAS